MDSSPTKFEKIQEALREKACLKQEIYRNTLKAFSSFKQQAISLIEELKSASSELDQDVKIEYIDKGTFEFHIKFGGDVLIFYMHSNVFGFEKTHSVWQTPYAKEDGSRTYCGMINVYNFLADSFKYNRLNDSGFLIGRIFINREDHFFVEGKRQLGFLYDDFINTAIDPATIRSIMETAMLYAMSFDLYTPSYEQVQEISVGQMVHESSIMRIKTAKRLGYKFSFDEGEKSD